MTASEVVSEISKLGYPPTERRAERAQGAALLLMAKDQLTALASPARGLTIGYTAMFLSNMKDLREAQRSDGPTIANDRRSAPNVRSPRNARVTLAFVAFGTLIGHVRTFKRIFNGLIVLAFLWLFLTIITYWDVALGRLILQRLDQSATAEATLLKKGFSVTQCATPPSADCVQWTDAQAGITRAYKDLDYFVLCKSRFCGLPIHVLRWGFMLCGIEHNLRAETRSGLDAGTGPNTLDQSVGSVITVFSTYILSMMFGLLGTLIAVIRAIQYKIRDSLLGPRDMVVSLIGLPMGLIAGVAVGLFFSPSDAQVSSTIGNVSLTASGLGFLAGYGAEAFFAFLDGLLTRVFPANATGNEPAK